MNDLSGERILVLGAGKSGVAAARLAHSRGAEVLVLDSAPLERLSAVWEELSREGIELRCQCQSDHWADGAVSRVVVSPGIAQGSPLHRLGESTHAPMYGELEFGASFLSCPMIAVTGTNGKTTTTELLNACLASAGCRVQAAGNIGLPVSQVALDGAELDYLVLEVSSFQLEHATHFHPTVAVLLNVTPDHLDRHDTLEQYRAVKMRLLEQLLPGGTAVYPASLEEFLQLSPLTSRRRLWLDGAEPSSSGRPAASDWCVAPDGLRRLVGKDGNSLREEKLLGRSSLRLQGNHNLANVLAVIASLDALGIPLEKYRKALSNFQSGPHRIQLVATRNGVQYVDDSKATDVDAMVQALRTLGPGVGKNIHLIAGGLDKGCTLSEAEREFRIYVKDVSLIGACRQRLAREWGACVPCRECQTMAEAVASASENAVPGDVVLLSPGCASMDMFRSYEERGTCFQKAVEAIPEIM